MAQSRIADLESQMAKLMTVVNNGNDIQQYIGKQQSQMKDKQLKLETKLDRIMQMLEGACTSDQGEVNTSFTEEETSISLNVVAKNGADTILRCPNENIDNQYEDTKKASE